MKIIVISDSHKNTSKLSDIMEMHSDAAHVFFLGDMASDIEDYQYIYPSIRFHILSGNCDFFSPYPSSGIEKIGSHNIFYTHGHSYSVKETISYIISGAKERRCDIVLYGHTHIPDITYREGLYIINPGSVSRPRSSKATYALIDISEKGVLPSIIEI